MKETVAFMQEHWDELCAAFTALIAFCSIVVKLTPTQKDDSALEKIIKILDCFSIVNPKGTIVVKDIKTEKK